jgi:OB-fold nucleic acid binding domain
MFACIFTPATIEGPLLSDFAYAFSPLLEETSPGTVVIDVEGCELLFGSAYGLVNEMARRAINPPSAGGLACKVNVALAANPDTAIHAAKFFEGISFISPGEEITGLGDLPVESLCFELSGLEEKEFQDLRETLKLWGINTFKDFAALPTAGVSQRLGQAGVRLQRLARGKTDRHLKLMQTPPVFENSIEFDYPLAELEALSFILSRLLNQLCARLTAYALATNELQVRMKLEHGAFHDRTLNLPYAMRDHKVFLKLLLLDTEMHPPPAGIVALSLSCEPVKPRVTQNGLFIPLAPEPEKLELTLARLAKLLGEGNIGSPLAQMTAAERMNADFRGTGLTIGKHPVATHRVELNKLGATRATDIYQLRNGLAIRVAGWVIVRQRPGTAKGFMFLTLEDETGVANIIVTPQLFDKNRRALVDYPFLMIEGTLQNQDNVVSVKAKRIRPLSFKIAAAPSHDFH